MNTNDFYEVDGYEWFIPVELIEENKRTKELEVVTTESGRITFVPTIYRFPKPPEPEKVTVPKFVAEWYEIYKNDLDPAIYNIITRAYKKVNGENDDLLDTFETWFVYEDNSILTLVKMYLFGYEIEKEKLYTVEIPNPNSNWKYTFLAKKDNRGVLIYKTDNDCWKADKINQLTEAEIKQDFEWAWQWAKEVE